MILARVGLIHFFNFLDLTSACYLPVNMQCTDFFLTIAIMSYGSSAQLRVQYQEEFTHLIEKVILFHFVEITMIKLIYPYCLHFVYYRYKQLEKAFCLAVDIGTKDLFMFVH